MKNNRCRGDRSVRMPVRKALRLADYDYSKSGYYFVTLCIKDKHGLLGKVDVGATAPGRPHVNPTFWTQDKYYMPD
jgi:hypothetical protein